ncbi:MAG: hypothetical protein IT488_10760 [Gammaproteobacteria bacterium]|nr:hypothetical protein [Gammaproteobacteria bacterium]
MTTRPHELIFRRILLPLDSGAADSTDLDAAIRLAARLQAEVVGIFIEDVDLMRLAALPFAREMAPLSASARRIDAADMARALRARAGVLRARLQERALQARVSWSFHIVQGELLAEQLGEAVASDLIILDIGARRASMSRATDQVTRHFFSQGACTVWLRRALAEDERPIIALLDDISSGQRVLAVACQFARRDGKQLLVMIAADDAIEFARRAHDIGELLTADGMEAECRPLTRSAASDLIQDVTEARGKLLVIARDSPLASGAGYQRLLEDLPCEIVLAG